MILDLNINLLGIDEEFLEELDDFIEDYRVELFIMNLKNEEELERGQQICKFSNRFRYTLPVGLRKKRDNNCVGLVISDINHLGYIGDFVVIVASKDLNDSLKEALNTSEVQGVVLNAKEEDKDLKNFLFAISNDSFRNWSQEGLKELDLTKLVLMSNYPKYSYDELNVMIKKLSDITLRAEQSITARGSRGALKLFGLM